jgi:hypothetical protein
MAVASPEAQPGLAFATPGNWFAIRLPKDRADADQLAGELAGVLPDMSSADAVRVLVGDLVRACASLDVLCGYATVLDVPGGPLPASLVVNVWPLGGYTLEQVAAQMSAPDRAAGPPVSGVLDLPAGRTVRVERLREWGGRVDGRHPVSLIVQYVTAIPGTGQAAVLTFSTPALALADRLRPLFHGIAYTLRFDGLEPGR